MSKIIGNTVGTTTLRPNWAETNEKSSAYIGNKPTADDGNFLVGNGKGNLEEMTPAEVLSHINGASVTTLTTSEYDALVEAEQTNANVLYMLTDSDEEEYALKSDLDNYAKTEDIPSVVGLASTDYVDTKVAGIVNSAPETLNTLNELATALGNDANFATTVAQQIGEKADKEHEHSEYITETELAGKGYLTSVPDEYVTETELTNKKYLSEVKPEDVIFDYDLIVTRPVGSITEEMIHENGGAVELNTTNRTLRQVFFDLFGDEAQPRIIEEPSYTFTTSGDRVGEVGETFTLPTATFKVTSVGKYPWNETGIKFSGSLTSGDNTETFTDLVTDGTATVQATGGNIFTEGVTTFSFSGEYSYNEGNTPKTNIGNDSTEVSAIPAVTDETILTKYCTYTGYRKIFAFCWNDETTSFLSDIRYHGESTNGVWEYADPNGQVINIGAYAGGRQVVVAFPSTYKTPIFKYLSPFNTYDTIDASDIEIYDNAMVTDASGENAIEYSVCAYVNAVDFPSATMFRIYFE